MLSDALIWSDEFLDFAALRLVPGWEVIRFVFYFRTTLILGDPDENMREHWDEALRLFPEWPGFAPSVDQERCRRFFARRVPGPAPSSTKSSERWIGREADNQTARG